MPKMRFFFAFGQCLKFWDPAGPGPAEALAKTPQNPKMLKLRCYEPFGQKFFQASQGP